MKIFKSTDRVFKWVFIPAICVPDDENMEVLVNCFGKRLQSTFCCFLDLFSLKFTAHHQQFRGGEQPRTETWKWMVGIGGEVVQINHVFAV